MTIVAIGAQDVLQRFSSTNGGQVPKGRYMYIIVITLFKCISYVISSRSLKIRVLSILRQ